MPYVIFTDSTGGTLEIFRPRQRTAAGQGASGPPGPGRRRERAGPGGAHSLALQSRRRSLLCRAPPTHPGQSARRAAAPTRRNDRAGHRRRAGHRGSRIGRAARRPPSAAAVGGRWAAPGTARVWSLSTAGPGTGRPGGDLGAVGGFPDMAPHVLLDEVRAQHHSKRRSRLLLRQGRAAGPRPVAQRSGGRPRPAQERDGRAERRRRQGEGCQGPRRDVGAGRRLPPDPGRRRRRPAGTGRPG